MIKVYGVHGSPYVRKVFIALDIKDVPYEIVRQMPFSEDAEYLKINPLGKIPSLVDGDLTLCDSKVICQYLDDAYPEPRLYPTRPNDWARAAWYEDLAGGRVSELAASIFFSALCALWHSSRSRMKNSSLVSSKRICLPCWTTWKARYPWDASSSAIS